MQDLISIIIPVYNVEKYLSECLDSVITQTYENLEILLINDGSTDGSGKICDEYAQKDSRIKVIHKENGGVSSARNMGLDLAQGEYIAFIDSDDRVKREYIQKLYEKVKIENAEVCLCHFSHFVGGETKKIAEPLPKHLNIDLDKKETLNFFYKYLSCRGISGSPCRSLYKKEIVENYRFSCEVVRAEDLLFNLEVLINCKRIVSIDEWLYEYRMNETSQTRSYNQNLLKNYLEVFRRIFNIFMQFNDKKKNNKLKRYFGLLCFLCFTNELKGKLKYKIGKVGFKKKINEIRESELYQYFTFQNGIKMDRLKIKLKFLIVWFLVKTRLV